MIEVIGFFFDTLRDIWSVIYANWLLAISFMIAIISFVISIVNNTKGEK